MSFPRYPEYKDSGIEWLGEVPEHWVVASLKRGYSIIGGSTPKSDSVTFWEGDIIWITPGDLSKLPGLEVDNSARKITQAGLDSCGASIVPEGSVILSTRAPIGTLGIARKKVCTNQGCKALVPLERQDSRFCAYLLLVSTEKLNILGRGTTFLELSGDALGSFPASFPPLTEQTQIARFLDHETAKIDALIREQERLIELLKEKRQAVISHAVTKGLNPDAPMKDSGVEWLGEVPEHWVVGKLRWYATIQGGIAKGKDYEDKKTISLPYLRVANVQAGYVDLTEVKEIAVLESEIDRYSLKSGDVLMNEGGDNDKLGRGTVWKAEIDPCLHQNHVFAIRPNEHLNPEWLAIFTQSSRARSYFYLNSKQSTNLASISSSNVMSLDLAMPPVEEQRHLLDFIAEELQRFNELHTQAETGILLLSERRSALISAAVTGKIDVRNWQPPSNESAFPEDVRQAGMEVTL